MANLKKQYKEFIASNLNGAFTQARNEGYRVLCFPELVDCYMQEVEYRRSLMNGEPPNLDSRHLIKWEEPSVSASIRATGKTSQGAKVAVYAHIPNWATSPEGLKEIKKPIHSPLGFTTDFPIPQDELIRLIGYDGKTDEKGNRLVSVIGDEELKRDRRGKILDHLDGKSEYFPLSGIFGTEKRARGYINHLLEISPHRSIVDTISLELSSSSDSPRAGFLRLDKKGHFSYSNLEFEQFIGKYDLTIGLEPLDIGKSLNGKGLLG